MCDNSSHHHDHLGFIPLSLGLYSCFYQNTNQWRLKSPVMMQFDPHLVFDFTQDGGQVDPTKGKFIVTINETVEMMSLPQQWCILVSFRWWKRPNPPTLQNSVPNTRIHTEGVCSGVSDMIRPRFLHQQDKPHKHTHRKWSAITQQRKKEKEKDFHFLFIVINCWNKWW